MLFSFTDYVFIFFFLLLKLIFFFLSIFKNLLVTLIGKIYDDDFEKERIKINKSIDVINPIYSFLTVCHL